MPSKGGPDRGDVVPTLGGILLGPEKEGNLTICNNMVPLEGITLREISQIEGQVSWEAPFTWNLKNHVNKQNRDRLLDAEAKHVSPDGRGVGAG